MAPRHGQQAARLRAIRGYSGLHQNELAPKLGISVETLSGMENGRRTISDERLLHVADLCEVPRVFAELGFAPLTEPISDSDQRLYAVEQQLQKVRGEVKRLAAASRRKPPGALGRRASGSDSKVRSPKKPRKPKAEDDAPGSKR